MLLNARVPGEPWLRQFLPSLVFRFALAKAVDRLGGALSKFGGGVFRPTAFCTGCSIGI